MKKSERRMLFIFLTPIVVSYLAVYLYPTLRTFYMTMFKIAGVSAPASQWEFVGFGNFQEVFKSPLFRRSFANIMLILFIGGFFTFLISILFAYLLRGGMKGSRFWKAVIYLPNVITPVAMVTMWTQYAFNNKFGLLNTVFNFLGLESLAEIPWTSSKYAFWAMLIAYTFGGIGYYMVMFMASMDKVPQEIYECASIEGANAAQSFFKITLPLIKDNLKTATLFWSLGSINFFIWSRVFSINNADPTTLSPANYMYGLIFGSGVAGNVQVASINVGTGAVVGVVLCACAIIVYILCELLYGKEKYEY